MEGAFTHVGNHLISDSAAAIKAGTDDFSTLDMPDPNSARRADDDDNHTETYDDDNDSIDSPVDGMGGLTLDDAEEKPLPAHACA